MDWSSGMGSNKMAFTLFLVGTVDELDDGMGNILQNLQSFQNLNFQDLHRPSCPVLVFGRDFFYQLHG